MVPEARACRASWYRGHHRSGTARGSPISVPRSISAVLPAFNESAVIATTVRRTHEALESAGAGSFEVIVVDDGSGDATKSECEAIAATLPRVRVISHGANRGYGRALRTGFEAASGDAVLLMDSDGQFDPNDVQRLLPHWTERTVVCGYRAHRNDPLFRRLNNAAFFAVVNARVGRTARDVNCGFKLFPAAVGRGLTSDGALVSTELLVKARDDGYRIIDVPIPHAPRLTGSPTGAKPSVVLRAFTELWDMDRQRRRMLRRERTS
ncbi:MAG: glycosyltransferase family 2 protein [Candidatus Dormibacteria bacterium]